LNANSTPAIALRNSRAECHLLRVERVERLDGGELAAARRALERDRDLGAADAGVALHRPVHGLVEHDLAVGAPLFRTAPASKVVNRPALALVQVVQVVAAAERLAKRSMCPPGTRSRSQA